MQKKHLKASILIWSLFMLSFISISFIFLSSKLVKNIDSLNKLSEVYESFLQKDSYKKSAFIDDLTWEYYINSDEKIVFSDTYFFTWFIYDKEDIDYIFYDFVWTNELNINIIYWWPIKYEIFTYSWSSNYKIDDFWIIYDSGSLAISLDNTYLSWKLLLSNLWAKSIFTIDSIEEIKNLDRNYKLYKDIWWKWFEIENSSLD